MPSALKELSSAILNHIAQQLRVSLHSLLATIKLLDEGGTVPFIARYRKEVTGNLDEVAIGAIEEKLAYFREFEERRETVLKSIAEQGKLTAELTAKIQSSLDKTELEDLYLPYRPKRRTKATIAREKGLEPLALYLWEQQARGDSLSDYAQEFVNADKGVSSGEEALEGARHIIAERISETPEFRGHLRQMMLREGKVVSRKIEDAVDAAGKFSMYYDYSEAASKIPSHRMLAIRRGSEESVLYFQIELESVAPVAYLKSKVLRARGEWTPQLELAVEDAWKRLLNLSIQTEVRLELKERSDEEAIRVFRENLQNLLLAPPAGSIAVLGIDPGLRTGCKIAAVDATGKFLDHGVIYPLEPKNDTVEASKAVLKFIEQHKIQAISIGNGTGSRETAAFVQDLLREAGLSGVFSVVVNESGASVYSASEVARHEFPDLDLTVRGAISIARRLQDPLAELVKIDPKAIGVGQYQHDVDQRKLNHTLDNTVESCVNRVGVDLNSASHSLLKYVAGINERTAQKIVVFRNEHGLFRSRVQLMAVPGFGPKTFEQAAGFLRIRGGDNPLDFTAVHPESYPIVEQIASSLKIAVRELIEKPALADTIKLETFRTEKVGMYTLRDIQEELLRPGRDPRQQFTVPKFQATIREISDLTPGMVLEGAVTNVTNFGAFVDVGVHQDGLVHISELSISFIQDPHQAVKVGEIVKVQVLNADPKTKRISLSIKALQQSTLPKMKHGQTKQMQESKTNSIADKLSTFSDRFRTR